MNGAEWSLIGYNILLFVLLVFVAIGAIPILATAYQFLAIPFHAAINHYKNEEGIEKIDIDQVRCTAETTGS